MLDFWRNINRPVLALAPMAGFTDSAFRQICKDFGADVLYSEMASAAALFHDPDKTLDLIGFSETERPYVVQLFGSDPKHFAVAAGIVARRIKPDGIDINFGCPVKKVRRQGAGAVLMDDPKRSREIIKAVLGSSGLPVSLKTRTRGEKTGVLEFLDYMQGLDIKALMIHGRSLKRMFQGPIDTGIIRKARDHFGGLILANGGIYDHDGGIRVLENSGADGLGVARGALGRPWIFKALRSGQSAKRSPRAVFKTALKHAELAFKLKGKPGLIEMRKHLCWYVNGLPGAKKLRKELIQVETLDEIRKIFLKETN